MTTKGLVELVPLGRALLGARAARCEACDGPGRLDSFRGE
jgi:hypothetical protein